MTPPAPTPPGFQVAFRPRAGRPWVVLAAAPTREAATARMFELMQTKRGGGWHVRPAPAAEPGFPRTPRPRKDHRHGQSLDR